MKQLFSLLILGFLSQYALQAQVRKPNYPDSLFSAYYHQRVTLFKALPQTKGDVIFVGNSITDGSEWDELFGDGKLKNRGISGDITAGVIHRIDEVANRKPAKVFLMIGTNDLARNISPDSVLKNIFIITDYLKQQTPGTKIFVQSILPVNNIYGMFNGHTGKGKEILHVNTALQAKAQQKNYTYVDLYTPFSDVAGKMNPALSNDGLHLKGEAYLLWKHIIQPYVYDLQTTPSIIPLPQSLTWKKGAFPLYASKTIVIKDERLRKEAQALQSYFKEKGLDFGIADKASTGEPYIVLEIDKQITAPQFKEEAYRLNVDDRTIRIAASSTQGIFNGIQTLRQLNRDNVIINACDITDWPAFSWRAYMIDVGRNYQSMESLKQQIDVMGRHKLNIFHFHPTEDVAWRIAIKQYPELTAPEHMTRNKGLYYTEAEIKELIAYCKERYITFIPEIDMPGHSAAFKRAMKTDMQSDSGLVYVKNILKELIETYDFPYIHIGADEVKITNKNFVPEVSKYIQSFGKQVIGWEPGGNFIDHTIRQMWMDDNAHIADQGNIQYVDSRHLYINHMDPLEAVTTIFNRRISNVDKANANAIGATLCTWHDRAAGTATDVLNMNPVYPGILTFAERIWRGGGKQGWVAAIGSPGDSGTQQFMEFENRLLDQQKLNFSNYPFPYKRQSASTWKLYGPYANGGALTKSFAPENKGIAKLKPVKEVVGGTIIWRHWWAPLISGVLEDAKENTTWYASSRIWSDEDTVADFWIGFNNLSRSPATDSPKPGTWDNHQSKLWVNGTLIDPPAWKRGGQKGHSEIPLVDEGYEYRAPTKIVLKKGWNEVLLKSPIGGFKGKDWQNPEKWMFTFVRAD
jgi:hexosaminidase